MLTVISYVDLSASKTESKHTVRESTRSTSGRTSMALNSDTSAAAVESLRKELEVERRRCEKLDQLLVTNSNLRERLKQELQEERSRCDTLSAEAVAQRDAATADAVKWKSEASTYKEMYMAAMKEVSQFRLQLQEQKRLVEQKLLECDELGEKLTRKEIELEAFSPLKRIAKRQLDDHDAVLDLDTGDSGEGAPTVHAGDDSRGDLDDSRVGADEIQRVVVGLYRRLKAAEVVLKEVSQSRLDALAKQVELQREIENLQRRLALRSPMVARREAAAANGAATSINVSRSSSAARRPVSCAASTASSRPVSATRTNSAPRRPVAQTPSAGNLPLPSSASLRSHSATSATDKRHGGDALRMNAQQLRGELGIRPRSKSPVTRTLSPVNAPSSHGIRRVSPPSRLTQDALKANGAPKDAPVIKKDMVSFRNILKGLAEQPPVIARRTPAAKPSAAQPTTT